jgi:hypothetical protein
MRKVVNVVCSIRRGRMRKLSLLDIAQQDALSRPRFHLRTPIRVASSPELMRRTIHRIVASASAFFLQPFTEATQIGHAVATECP